MIMVRKVIRKLPPVIFAGVLGMFLSTGALALPQSLADKLEVDEAEWNKLGEARYRRLMIHVYDARLWVSNNDEEPARDRPLMLEIQYARSLSAEELAEHTAEDMVELGQCESVEDCWSEEELARFEDVERGDDFVIWYRPDGTSGFYLNGELRSENSDAGEVWDFLAIWLSPDSPYPRVRDGLLGDR